MSIRIVIGMVAALVITGAAACTKSEAPAPAAAPKAEAPKAEAPKPAAPAPAAKPAEKPAMGGGEAAKPAEPAAPKAEGKPAAPKPESDGDET